MKGPLPGIKTSRAARVRLNDQPLKEPWRNWILIGKTLLAWLLSAQQCARHWGYGDESDVPTTFQELPGCVSLRERAGLPTRSFLQHVANPHPPLGFSSLSPQLYPLIAPSVIITGCNYTLVWLIWLMPISFNTVRSIKKKKLCLSCSLTRAHSLPSPLPGAQEVHKIHLLNQWTKHNVTELQELRILTSTLAPSTVHSLYSHQSSLFKM